MPSRRTVQHDAYPLRTVSQLTGLSPDLIRAWEKRYAVVAPERGARGARLYSPDDIAHLRLLARAVQGGRAIGDVASLTRDQLRELVASEPPPGAAEAERTSAATPTGGGTVARALDALQRYDPAGLTGELGAGLAALGTREFVRQVCSVLLHEVGERWERGELSIGQGHMASAAVRSMIHAMLQWNRRSVAGHVLLATPPGETHETGILMTALLLSEAGVVITYLGCDVPAADIVDAAEHCDAVGVVGLGITCDTNAKASVECARQVDRSLPAGKEIWLGGPAAAGVAARLRSDRVYVIDDARRLDARIAELTGNR